ncbi:hypothetical protein INT45_002208 [Circinella minor]|uniref:Uncharacterized protein n=1 Tax=Circinella minor TaxID=1195481 RepID=A0A8H7SFK9_9FUNG|nr:hypothetical protein INT45_002208 [Circinella minor]
MLHIFCVEIIPSGRISDPSSDDYLLAVHRSAYISVLVDNNFRELTILSTTPALFPVMRVERDRKSSLASLKASAAMLDVHGFNLTAQLTTTVAVKTGLKDINQVKKFVGRPPGALLPGTRDLGTMLATQLGVTVENLVIQGNWSSRKMFEQFYRISVQTNVQ